MSRHASRHIELRNRIMLIAMLTGNTGPQVAREHGIKTHVVSLACKRAITHAATAFYQKLIEPEYPDAVAMICDQRALIPHLRTLAEEVCSELLRGWSAYDLQYQDKEAKAGEVKFYH